MFRYLVTVETRDANDESFYTQTLLSRLSPLTGYFMNREEARQRAKYPQHRSIEIVPIEESEYRRRKDFENRHED